MSWLLGPSEALVPLRHHTKDRLAPHRALWVMVLPPDSQGRIQVAAPGDLQGPFFWPDEDVATRGESLAEAAVGFGEAVNPARSAGSWALAAPARVENTQGALALIRGHDLRGDTRYSVLLPREGTRLPLGEGSPPEKRLVREPDEGLGQTRPDVQRGTYVAAHGRPVPRDSVGLVMAGTDELSQEGLFMPGWDNRLHSDERPPRHGEASFSTQVQGWRGSAVSPQRSQRAGLESALVTRPLSELAASGPLAGVATVIALNGAERRFGGHHGVIGLWTQLPMDYRAATSGRGPGGNVLCFNSEAKGPFTSGFGNPSVDLGANANGEPLRNLCLNLQVDWVRDGFQGRMSVADYRAGQDFSEPTAVHFGYNLAREEWAWCTSSPLCHDEPEEPGGGPGDGPGDGGGLPGDGEEPFTPQNPVPLGPTDPVPDDPRLPPLEPVRVPRKLRPRPPAPRVPPVVPDPVSEEIERIRREGEEAIDGADEHHGWVGSTHELHLPGLALRALPVQGLYGKVFDGRYDRRAKHAARRYLEYAPVVLRLFTYGQERGPKLGLNADRLRPYNAGPGGIVLAPGVITARDFDGDCFSRRGVTPDSAYLLALKSWVRYAAGCPELGTGGVKEGWSWGLESDRALTFKSHDAAGTATERARLGADGLLALGPSNAGVRSGFVPDLVFDPPGLEAVDGANAGTVPLTVGALRIAFGASRVGDGLWARFLADNVTDERDLQAPDADGTLATEEHVAAGYQPLDAELTAIAGLTSAADKGIQFTGAGTAATYGLTAAGKALLDDANAAAQRNTLGMGSIATQDADAVAITGGAITGVPDLLQVLEVTEESDVLTGTVALTTVETLTVPEEVIEVGTRFRLRARLTTYRPSVGAVTNIATWKVCVGTTAAVVVNLPAYGESDEPGRIEVEVEFEVRTIDVVSVVQTHYRALHGEATLNGVPYYDVEATSGVFPDTTGDIDVFLRVQPGNVGDESYVERAELTVIRGPSA